MKQAGESEIHGAREGEAQIARDVAGEAISWSRRGWLCTDSKWSPRTQKMRGEALGYVRTWNRSHQEIEKKQEGQ